MKITQVRTGLKWLGLYLLANLLGGLVEAPSRAEVNGAVAGGIIFLGMIAYALVARRERRLCEAKDVSNTSVTSDAARARVGASGDAGAPPTRR